MRPAFPSLKYLSDAALARNLCGASSVTVIYTEERRSGVASFRMSRFGDVSHLYAGGRERRLRHGSVRCIHGLTSGMTDGRFDLNIYYVSLSLHSADK